MNLLHICAHYSDGKLWSVAWLPVGRSTMSIFTWVFWLAAAVFCQLDSVRACVCASASERGCRSCKQAHPVLPHTLGTDCRSQSLCSTLGSVHTNTYCPRTHRSKPYISHSLCSCPFWAELLFCSQKHKRLCIDWVLNIQWDGRKVLVTAGRSQMKETKGVNRSDISFLSPICKIFMFIFWIRANGQCGC